MDLICMRRYLRSAMAAYLFLPLTNFLVACTAGTRNSDPDTFTEGKNLANRYCQSCHLLPDPALATKNIWEEGILPQMGPKLGIFSFQGQNYPSQRKWFPFNQGFYPARPMMTDSEWASIIDYYGHAAPDSLAGQQRPSPLFSDNSVFQVATPVGRQPNPVTNLVQIDTVSHRIITADGLLGRLYSFDKKLTILDSTQTGRMMVGREREGQNVILCDIGLINPNDGRLGKIWLQEVPGKGPAAGNLQLIADSLRRPVQVTLSDLNGDGKKDILVCEFGNLLGALSWLENLGNHQYRRHGLLEVPGAIQAIVQDYNKDGLPDIWALFAQGDEKIVLLTNRGNGRFEAEDILRFPPIYGSTSFSLCDFNGDGYTDILYTAGDNADYSKILKPYHGVYVYMNDGNMKFKQKYFYPIHGCYKALARDFDGDGDLDIAAIAYFADFAQQPEEGFVYLENKGSWHFRASSLEQARYGRWLTMDAGDLDGDGRIDLILGNSSVGPNTIPSAFDWKKGPPFLFLRNISGGINTNLAAGRKPQHLISTKASGHWPHHPV